MEFPFLYISCNLNDNILTKHEQRTAPRLTLFLPLLVLRNLLSKPALERYSLNYLLRYSPSYCHISDTVQLLYNFCRKKIFSKSKLISIARIPQTIFPYKINIYDKTHLIETQPYLSFTGCPNSLVLRTLSCSSPLLYKK